METGSDLCARAILDLLFRHKITNAVGVPDSKLKGFIHQVQHDRRFLHIAATNEAEALAIACGQFIGTGIPSLVYMQNSGFTKAIHPLASLMAGEIWNIPALLLIGWRGYPGGPRDEPQHKLIGRRLPALLEAIELKYHILAGGAEEAAAGIESGIAYITNHRLPFALVVQSDVLSKAPPAAESPGAFLPRETIIAELLAGMPPNTLFIATTGMTARELFFLREKNAQQHKNDIYTIGGMGLSSALGLGLATVLAARPICILDGDGAALMHLSNLCSIGNRMPANLYHFIIDNGAYESTGSQPTISAGVNLAQIAKAAGYRFAEYALDKASLHKCLDEMLETTGPGLVIVKSARGVAAQAGRAPAPPREYIETFMHNLTNNTGAGEAAAAAFRTLTAYLEGTGGKGKVLILTYKAALANRDIHSLMEQIKRMYRAVVIAAFSTPLLTVDDLVGLEAEIKTGFRPTLIITIGGGNLIDAGKCLKFLYATGTTAAALPANSGKQHRVSDLAYNPLHVAIPTTNGSGSAATTFAVFHHQKQRYSLDFPFLLPDRCFSFPFLLHTLPRDMTVANILDALCHCVESLWSVKATPQSMEYAREALECIHALLPGFYAGEPAPGVEVLEQMLAASNLAGKAINISQTTLVHGLAYPLTAAYGTAHGLACFLNLPVVWEYNTHNIHNAAARAPQLAAAVDTVCTLFAQDEQCMAGCFRDVLQRLGCSSCLEDYFPASAIETIIHSAVNSGGCTQNNPLAVDSALLRAAYSRYYTLPGQGSL